MILQTGPLGRAWPAWAVAAALAVLAGGALFAWVRSASPPTSSAAMIVLRRGNVAEPESLDVHRARSEPALTILRDLYEGLMALGPDGAPQPAAAESFSVSSDRTGYVFHLRPEARWSNGDALVAEDFVAAWRRLVDPRTGAQYADLLGVVRGATAITAGAAKPETLGVRAVDAATLAVDLERPTPYFLDIVSHPATFPLHRPSLAARGRAFAKPGVMVSNGAFVLSRWDFGSHLVAMRNPRYWNDRETRLDAVEYYSFTDADAELRAYRGGQLDITSTLPPAQLPWIRDHMPAELHIAPQLAVYYLGLNLRKPPFSRSPDLRRALSMVIDRERLVATVTGAGEIPAYGFVPPQVRGYAAPLPDYARLSMPERITRARRLLAGAGGPPHLELFYNSGELHNRIAVAVAQMWHDALGVETTLRAEEFKVLLQDIDRGEAMAFRASWVGDYDDPFGFLQVMQSHFGINLPRYSNPQYDALLERAQQSGDGDRNTLLAQAEAVMLTDQPLIPLYFYVSKHLVAARVDGWRDNVMNVAYSKNLGKSAVAGQK